VSLKTTLHGNAHYQKRVIESEHVTETGAERAKWETVRTITDPAEHEKAETARAKAGSLIRGVCSHSAFGLLCPESRTAELEAAIAQARAVADAFNAEAGLSRISVYVITGRIAPDDVEAVRAINSEIAELMQRMTDGISQLDVKAIREAASKAKSVGAMLPAETASRVQDAIAAARATARTITKAGETAAQEIDTRAIKAITEARTAFLDLDDSGQEIITPTETGRAIDLDAAPKVDAMPLFSTGPATAELEF
jgi:hypothetical protein